MINGIICIDKPDGFTSFDVIAKMRVILKMKKLGHTGTLDPMATGVLPVFAGSAAKAISIIPQTEKSYRADFSLGIVTDTYDITGRIIQQNDFDISEAQVKEILKKFRGKISQLPPMYSAVSVDGKRLYELARKGIEVERPVREVEISRLELISFNEKSGRGTIEMTCSKGTFVRTVIHDMGQSLGCGGVMTALERTAANGFTIDKCITLERLKQLKDEHRLSEVVIPVERMFENLPKIKLSVMKTGMYKNGVKLRLRGLNAPMGEGMLRVYGYDNEFIGIAKPDMNEMVLKIVKNLSGERK